MNNEAVNMLVAKWAEPGGIPFKGRLIDSAGCMCAQGQALHYIAGWDAKKLRSVDQSEADAETARQLGISRAHAVLLRSVNDSRPGAPSIVLTDPAKVLGDQAHTVLAFWRHLDGMTAAEWSAARAAALDAARAAARAAALDAAWAAAVDAAVDAAWAAALDAAWAAAVDAALDAVWAAAVDAAVDAAWAAALDAAWAAAVDAALDAVWAAALDAAGDAAVDAAWATNEIQGAALMRKRGQPFYFLPLFGFADPEAVLAAYPQAST